MRRHPAAAGIVLAAVLLCLAAARLAAHELGSIRVSARFSKDGTYRIDAIVDREHLPPGFGDGARIDPKFLPVEHLTPAREARVAGIVAAAIDGVEIAFDGEPVRPAVELVPPEGGVSAFDASELTIRFTGPIPPGSRTFTWRNSGAPGTNMLAIRVAGEEEASRQWVEKGARSQPFVLKSEIVPMTRAQVVQTYLKLGYTHILPKGLDHILFVIGLFLLSPRFKTLLLQVTAFTIAHSITLGLSMYGVVSLPPRVVEPLIALSIAYVAIENLLTRELKPWRVALVFMFGLLHGLGFAGVLRQLGLPRGEFLTALLTFNAGVEIGQLTIIATAWLLVGTFMRRPWYRKAIVIPASCGIALTGLYWTVTRLL